MRSVKNHEVSTCGLNTLKTVLMVIIHTLSIAQARRSLIDTREDTFVE